MLRSRTDHFGPQQHAATTLGIDSEQALVPEHHPATALVLERYLADHVVAAFEFGKCLAGHRNLWVRENDGQRRASQTGPDVRIASGVVACNAAFVRSFVK